MARPEQFFCGNCVFFVSRPMDMEDLNRLPDYVREQAATGADPGEELLMAIVGGAGERMCSLGGHGFGSQACQRPNEFELRTGL